MFNKHKIQKALLLAALGDSIGNVIYGMDREEIAKKYDLNNIHAFSEIISHINHKTSHHPVEEDMPDIDVSTLSANKQEFQFSIDNVNKFEVSYYSQVLLFIFEACLLSQNKNQFEVNIQPYLLNSII